MKPWCAIALIVFGLTQAESVFAHGGGHGGPPPAPPPPGNPGPGNPGPGTSPPAKGPFSGIPPVIPKAGTAVSGLKNGGVNTGGFVIVDDHSDWQTWWKYNQYAFLGLEQAKWQFGLRSGEGSSGTNDLSYKPTPDDIENVICPALLKVLQEKENQHLTSAAIVAFAKMRTCKNPVAILTPFFKESVQELVETTAFSLGLFKMESVAPLLLSLGDETDKGRSLLGKNTMSSRTRAFALYGLGLLGSENDSEGFRKALVQEILKIQPGRDIEVGVAKVITLGLIPDEKRTAVPALIELFESTETPMQVRAQVPISLARLLKGEYPGPRTPRSRVYQRMLAGAEDRSEQQDVRSSCVLSLPYLAHEKDHADLIAVLESALKAGRGVIERQFAAISLGRVASPQSQQILAKFFSKSKTIRPWVSLGLAIAGRKNDALAADSAAMIREVFQAEKNPSNLGAYAISLGILRDKLSEKAVHEQLNATKYDELQGFCALALGMMRSQESIADIQGLIRGSRFRPELLKQAAIALALLGDKSVCLELVGCLRNSTSLAQQTAYGVALGWVGDRRAIQPLIELLQKKENTPLGRAFMIVALGMIGDLEPFRWKLQIATDLNYLAVPSTLFDPANFGGILDIL